MKRSADSRPAERDIDIFGLSHVGKVGRGNEDQFIAVPEVQLTFDRLLVVPTEKVIPTPAGPSTWGRVKSQYR